MQVAEQIALLYCGINNLLREVPLDKVEEFETMFLDVMRTRHKESVLDVLASGVISDDVAAMIESVAKEITSTLN